MIELRGVTKTYNEGKSNEVHALNGVDLRIKDGESVAIMGVSGSGKSTLLHIIGCLDTLSGGSYMINGEEIGGLNNAKLSEMRNKKFGFVLQDYGLLMTDSVARNVEVPLYFNKELKAKEAKARVDEVLEELNITELKKRKVGQLSGGQRQRVAIARAIANDPDVILADEPTGALDSKTANEIMEVLTGLTKKGKTLIMVTHDKNMAAKMGRTVKIEDGVIEDGEREASTAE